MLYTIDNMSRTPVYEQIIRQTEQFLTLGILKAGDPLPSVRMLSTQLSVNPNTIQKSFTEMSNRGLTVSVPGRGSFISGRALDIIREESLKQLSGFQDLARELYLAGVSEDELIQALKEGIRSCGTAGEGEKREEIQ